VVLVVGTSQGDLREMIAFRCSRLILLLNKNRPSFTVRVSFLPYPNRNALRAYPTQVLDSPLFIILSYVSERVSRRPIGTLEVEGFLVAEGVTTLLAFCKEETTNKYVVCVDVPPLL